MQARGAGSHFWGVSVIAHHARHGLLQDTSLMRPEASVMSSRSSEALQTWARCRHVLKPAEAEPVGNGLLRRFGPSQV